MLGAVVEEGATDSLIFTARFVDKLLKYTREYETGLAAWRYRVAANIEDRSYSPLSTLNVN